MQLWQSDYVKTCFSVLWPQTSTVLLVNSQCWICSQMKWAKQEVSIFSWLKTDSSDPRVGVGSYCQLVSVASTLFQHSSSFCFKFQNPLVLGFSLLNCSSLFSCFLLTPLCLLCGWYAFPVPSQGSCLHSEERLSLQINLSTRGDRPADLDKLKPYIIEHILVLLVAPTARQAAVGECHCGEVKVSHSITKGNQTVSLWLNLCVKVGDGPILGKGSEGGIIIKCPNDISIHISSVTRIILSHYTFLINSNKI